MTAEAGRIVAHLGLALAVSSAAIAALCPFARRLGLVDLPDSRKSHGREVPLIGGLAIFLAVLVGSAVLGWSPFAASLLGASSLVLAVGAWDDVSELAPRYKLSAQAVAGAAMIYASGIVLHTVGDLVGWRPIGLSVLAVPVTIFAVAGVVNAINMIDGMDGLAGSIAAIAFAWYAAVALASGLAPQAGIALLFCGASAGFLLFNLRIRGRPHAPTFLGDAGSLMLGFALAWLAIDLTQGAGRTFPPIAALWVVLLPLADCVSLMSRRLLAGRSPFAADRQHIHHYLLARGFTHNQALAALVAVSALFGAIGFAGWRWQVPEPLLFWPFFAGYFAYHGWIQRAWRRLEAERTVAKPVLLLDEEQARALG